MGAWGVLVEGFGAAAVGLLLPALGWAAFERLLAGLFRSGRRARRIHPAVSGVAGCGAA